MADELTEDALTAEDVLTFGPCVEAQVWTPVWIQEARAPIAVSAGRPKFGPVFNEKGIGRIAVIRPCVSRGRRIKGLQPIYTSRMLEANASVFSGWPMFMDHAPAAVQTALAKAGRSMKDLGGQVLKSGWNPTFVHEDDGQYGYQKGSVVAEAWATPLIRKMVGENPNLLHTSINAWPTSGKPGAVPWRPGVKGMLIEGIRRQPQGSVDYVVRGGAGGRLLLAEGLEDEGEWPEIGEWSEDDTRFVVSLAESFYASRQMAQVTLPTKPGELKDWLAENAPHLLPALAESTETEAAATAAAAAAAATAAAASGTAPQPAITEADVRRLLTESQAGQPTVEDFEQRLRESTETLVNEREAQRTLAEHAHALIESAEGIPPRWKGDLKARYAMTADGPSQALLVEAATDKDGNELSEVQVLEARVTEDLRHVRELIAEATGKPRVKGEGGSKPGAGGDAPAGKSSGATPFWRQRFVGMGIAESVDKAVEAFGGKLADGGSD